MDIYQIWTRYNNQWSKNEILLFAVVLFFAAVIVAGCVYRKKMNRIQAVAVVAMVLFLEMVFGSTVFTRTSTVRQYELIPFWSWNAVLRNKDRELLKEILLNCILLLPAGVLLPVIADHKVKWYRSLLFGVLISAIIETSQLIFKCGLFEWDDMIHNGLGCMVGSMMMNLLKKSYDAKVERI